MWPFVSGQNSTSPCTDIPASKYTLISGDYEILIGNVISKAGWTGPQNPNNTHHKVNAVEHCGDKGYLYNIKKDPSEHVNLATEMPDMLQEMRTRLAKYQATSALIMGNHGLKHVQHLSRSMVISGGHSFLRNSLMDCLYNYAVPFLK